MPTDAQPAGFYFLTSERQTGTHPMVYSAGFTAPDTNTHRLEELHVNRRDSPLIKLFFQVLCKLKDYIFLSRAWKT